MNKPLYISFAAQKGGVGKSVFTSLLASYIHYHTSMSVAVIDCDYPQHSLIKFREREIKKLKASAKLSNVFTSQMSTLNKKAYQIIGSDITEGVEIANNLSKTSKGSLDIILFDFPGTINTPGMITALAHMDYLFIPIEADRLVLESELEFAHTMQNIYATHDIPGQVYLYWNKIQRNVRTSLFDNYDSVIKELGLTVLANRIYHAAAFQKEMELESDPKLIFRSTLFPYSNYALRGANIPIADFMNEIIKILNLNINDNNESNE